MSPGIEPHGGGQRDGLRHLTLWDCRIRHAAPQDSLQEPEIVTDDPPMRRCNRQHVEAPEGIVGDDGGRDRQSAALDGDADHDVEVPIPLVADAQPLGVTTACVTVAPGRLRLVAPRARS